MFVLSGCEDVQIFETKTDKTKLVPYRADELKRDIYYIKQGTKFYQTYKPKEGNSKGSYTSVDPTRVLAVVKEETLLPKHYIGEIVAYASNQPKLEEINIERYRSLGYSVGAFAGTFDETEGCLMFNKNANVAKNSSLYDIVKETSSQEIRIVSINGEPLSTANIDMSSGVITGLEKDVTYIVGFYAGTYYYEAEIVADTLMLQSYEFFSYPMEYVDFTQNGYISFNTPQDLRSGYYFINGTGLFRYYDYEKTGSSDDETNMNVSYYETERDRLEAYSRQYSLHVETRTKDLTIKAQYSNYIAEGQGTGSEENNVKGYVFSPSGKEYEMILDTSEKTLSLDLTEAEIGDWTINIVPKTLSIDDISTESNTLAEEATLKEEVFVFLEDDSNIVFTAETKGDGEVFGYVITPDGKSYDMEYKYDDNTHKGTLKYELAYVPVGEYKIKVYYHPTSTDILSIDAIDNVETSTDIIIVED